MSDLIKQIGIKKTDGTYDIRDIGVVSENISGTILPESLPIASEESFGGVKVDGSTITVNENGIISTVSAEKDGSGNIITDTYLTKENPTGSGAVSFGRIADTTIGEKSIAAGNKVTASGTGSHAEGNSTTASGTGSHAEGNSTTASGLDSHAEGYNTTARGPFSHAEGYSTTAGSDYQHVQGKFNIEDTKGIYADVVGGGNASERKNIYTLDWSGNGVYAGSVTAEGFVGDLTGNADTATQAEKDGDGNVIASTYLPLSGGAMTGDISFAGTKKTDVMIKFLDNTEDTYGNGIIVGYGGLTVITSGEARDKIINQSSIGTAETEKIILASDNIIGFYSNCNGEFSSAKYSYIGTDGIYYGDVTGTASKATADASGNVITSTYLPLAGGTITGTIKKAGGNVISHTTTTGAIQICGGTSTSTGAYLSLYGSTQSDHPGYAYITAYKDSSTTNTFAINPAGGATLGGKAIITASTGVTHTADTAVGGAATPVYINSSGVATACSYNGLQTKYNGNAIINTGTSSSVNLCGGTTTTDGGVLVLRGQDQTNYKGFFELWAYDSDNGRKKLIGKPDGSLLWNSKNVVTSTASTAVGGAATPIYVSSTGVATACSSTVGGTATPVYMKSGAITKCSSDIGSASAPVYMDDGEIKACTSLQTTGAIICKKTTTDSANAGGIRRTDGTLTYAQMGIYAIGTASDSSGSGTQGIGRLMAGNSTAYGSANNAKGQIMIFPASTAGAAIIEAQSGSTSNKTFYLPMNSSGNSFTLSVTSSDVRLKKDIEDSNVDALNLINNIKVRQFNWREDNKHQKIGFIANELRELDEKLTIGEPDSVGTEGEIIPLGIDLLYFDGYIVKALQELSSKITKLEEKIAILESKGE